MSVHQIIVDIDVHRLSLVVEDSAQGWSLAPISSLKLKSPHRHPGMRGERTQDSAQAPHSHVRSVSSNFVW